MKKVAINQLSRVLISQITNQKNVTTPNGGHIGFEFGMHGVCSVVECYKKEGCLYYRHGVKNLSRLEAVLLLIKRGHIKSAIAYEGRHGQQCLEFSGRFDGQDFKIYEDDYFGYQVEVVRYFGERVQHIPTEAMVSLFETAGSAGMPMPRISAYRYTPKKEWSYLFK